MRSPPQKFSTIDLKAILMSKLHRYVMENITAIMVNAEKPLYGNKMNLASLNGSVSIHLIARKHSLQ